MDHKTSTMCFYVPAVDFSLERTMSSRTANNMSPTDLYNVLIHVLCDKVWQMSDGNMSRWLLTSHLIRLWSALLTSKPNGTNFEKVQVDFYSPVLKHEDSESERMSLRLFYALWNVEWYKLQFYTFLVLAFLKDLSIAYFSLWLLC